MAIEPRQQVDDPQWSWHLGLDVTSTALLNDLYNQVELGEDRLERLISLFSLTTGFRRDQHKRLSLGVESLDRAVTIRITGNSGKDLAFRVIR